MTKSPKIFFVPVPVLQDLLERLPTHPADRLADLLPDRWKPVPADKKPQIVWLSADEIANLEAE